jgi:hypothetical protein
MQLPTTMTRRIKLIVIVAIVLTALMYTSQSTVKQRSTRSWREKRCLLFVQVHSGYWMHSNQMLAVVRSLKIAKAMGCSVLPMFLAYGPSNYKDGHVKMEHFFEFTDPELIVDLKDSKQGAWVADLASRVGNGSVKWTEDGLDRNSLGLHQNDNDTISIPCIIGRHSANDSRVSSLTKPFKCSSVHIFRDSLDDFKMDINGIIGIPMGFNMNVSCAWEEEGSGLVVPRMELQRAAKWILWTVVLGNVSIADATKMLGSLQHVPLLNDSMYAQSPSTSPLYTAHVRTDKWLSCSKKMRFALCGTNDTIAANTLINATRNVSAILLLAGDSLGGVSRLNNSGVLMTMLQQPQKTRKIVEASHLYGLYKLILSHASLNLTDYTPFIKSFGQGAENAHDESLQALMDQILLGCGEVLGRFYQTHWSTFSFRAHSIGRRIGRQVCLSHADLHNDFVEIEGEMEKLLEQERDAGVDRSILHFKGSTNEWLPTEKTAGIGCSLKGHFLGSLHFAQRLANKDVPCSYCTAGWW